jgi:hypothetical protein
MSEMKNRPATLGGTDRTALLLMLGYVQNECRLLGDLDAAAHIAQATAVLERALNPIPAIDHGARQDWARLLESPLGNA